MIYSRWQYEQVPRLTLDSHPFIIGISNIEIPSTLQNIADLLVFMHMFIKEHLDLVLLVCAHGIR